MNKIEQHLTENFDRLDHIYNDLLYRYNIKKKELDILSDELSYIDKELKSAKIELDYYGDLLNELNNE